MNGGSCWNPPLGTRQTSSACLCCYGYSGKTCEIPPTAASIGKRRLHLEASLGHQSRDNSLPILEFINFDLGSMSRSAVTIMPTGFPTTTQSGPIMQTISLVDFSQLGRKKRQIPFQGIFVQ